MSIKPPIADYPCATPRAESTAIKVCADCDQAQLTPPLQPGEKACCGRCGAVIDSRSRFGPDFCLAFAVAGLILFPLANGLHLMSFSLMGNTSHNFIWTGVAELWNGGLRVVAVLVFTCTILAPLLLLLSLVYLHLSPKLGRRPRHGAFVERCLDHLGEWSMVDVYLLGVLVSFIKLSQLAHVTIDTGLYTLVAMLAATYLAWQSHGIEDK